MHHKAKAALMLLIIWIAGSAAAFYGLFLGHFGTFDEKRLWQQQPLLAAQTEQKLRQQLLPDRHWQAILITDSTCSCSSFAKQHLERLQQRQPELATTQLSDSEAKALGLDSPALPLLLLFNQQQLIYAGPLATDLLCSDNASLLDKIVSGASQLPGFWLNGESTACRCLVEPL